MTTVDSIDLSQLRVLVVDDEADIRLGLRRLATSLGAEVSDAEDGVAALEQLVQSGADVVLTDLMMPRMSGAELLVEVKRRSPETAVVILTGYGTIPSAVSCLQNGAAHFLTKPFDNAEVLRLVERLGRQVLAQRPQAAHTVHAGGRAIVAEDPRMRSVLELVTRVAPTPVSVLVEGESGTGKELVARAVHAASGVADRPFLAVNAAALSDTLLESELFGHERGAFTGAERRHDGVFAQARGGTVFLDEVASMSPSFQGKLLRVLQEHVVRPVGGNAEIPVEFRLIAATNRELEAMIATGAFREDLFYRLGVVRIAVPPLRERPADVPALAEHFLRTAARVSLGPNAPVPRVSAAALATLTAHAWRGNVRELENTIQRAVIVCTDGTIEPWHLGLDRGGWSPSAGEEVDYSTGKQRAVAAFQSEFVRRALEKAHGNVSHAAEACGLTRAALQRIMRQLGIERETFSA
ncbi:MAG: sigma-54-dependent Fis family transcriptional regulator [bacterium]|nr:sigma-54-dependent Fis family transcriptional regulator [bacterium]